MGLRTAARSFHHIGRMLRRGFHTAVQTFNEAAPRIDAVVQAAKPIWHKTVRPVLERHGYGHHAEAVDVGLRTYDNIRRSVAGV